MFANDYMTGIMSFAQTEYKSVKHFKDDNGFRKELDFW